MAALQPFIIYYIYVVKRVLTVLLIINATAVLAQDRNSVWIFGDSAGIDFSNINSPLAINSAMNGRGSCASVCDSSGNLQFYSWNLAGSDDSATFITNVLHDTMENGSRLTGGDAYNQIVILPFLGTSIYYVFHLGILTTYGLYYSLVDMNLNGGLGKIILKNIQINSLRLGDCLSTVKHGNGRDWWVVSKFADGSLTSNLNRFFVYLVTPDSIYNPIIEDFNDAKDVDFQKVIWHPSGDKFMLINLRGYMSEFNFDRCTGLITLNRNIYPELTSNFNRFFWEGAYSKNEKFSM